MDPSILYQNPTSTVILIDIPRSLEATQLISSPIPSSLPSSSSSSTIASYPSPSTSSQPSSPFSKRRRILSTPPLLHHYPSLDPKTPKARANFNLRLGPPSIQELLLRKHVEFALREIRDGYGREEWCLSRVVEKNLGWAEGGREEGGRRGRKRMRVRRDGAAGEVKDDDEHDGENENTELKDAELSHSEDQTPEQDPEVEVLDPDGLFFTNPHSKAMSLNIQGPDDEKPKRYHIPPLSTLLSGSLSSILPTFTSFGPSNFSLITLDPPWPNRSARRSSTYKLSRNTPSISSLLSSLPLQDHLSEDGVVAVWITNREAFREMVLGTESLADEGGGGGGLFQQWGVQLIEEWVWVKTTVKGEPIFDIEGEWRKPWEVLLVGRRKPSNHSSTISEGKGDGYGNVKRRIIAGVPDLHSRKPNLRGLFEKLLVRDTCQDGSRDGEKERGGKRYEALEIFARNLTAGWWCWGDEVLRFQGEECWVDGDIEEE